MIGTFRKRLRDGETLLGSMVTLALPAIAEILAEVGFDWLFIDGEHGPLDAGAIVGILQAAGERLACIVRVPGAEEAPIKKILDQGAQGIIVPQVNTSEQAASACGFQKKKSPLGREPTGTASPSTYARSSALP